MQQEYKSEFLKAILEEVRDQMDNENFSIIKRNKVPKGSTILPWVWQMKGKRHIKTRKIKRWKSRLKVDESKMTKGINYDKVYAPMASWNFIPLLINIIVLHNWNTKQIDYVQAFSQAPAKNYLYLKVPSGFEVEGGKKGEYALKLHKNVYGQKQAGRVCYKYLSKNPTEELWFEWAQVHECVFYRGKTIYVLYTDDSILAGPDQGEIEQVIKDLRKDNIEVTN